MTMPIVIRILENPKQHKAAIVFKNSYLIDEKDLQGTGNSYAFKCDNGCTVYTTKMSSVGEVAIYSAGTLVATLDSIYIKNADNFLQGYTLKAGTDYKLMKAGALNNANNPVKVYIVADGAGTGAVTDFDSITNEIDINGSGKKTVTVLNIESSGITFSGYKGATAPKIYSAGFDSLDCKPIYTADANTVAVGQSAVVMSPGYTGCAVEHNYNDFAMASYDFKSSNSNTKAWINFGDISITAGHELTVKVSGQSDLKISSSSVKNYAYVADNIDVNVSWDQKAQNDYFFAQIDFTNDAVIEFENSYLFDELDLRSNRYGKQFICPGKGCTVYTTKMTSAEVGIYMADELITTLDLIYKKQDGFLVGHHLSPSLDYRLKKTGDGNMNSIVKVYIVADIAGTADVMDFDSDTSEFDIVASGKQIVTVLSVNASGMTFSDYEGPTAPKIYSGGFDAVSTCIPVYIASSIENAAVSKIGVVSALATVDLGSVDASNNYHVTKFVDSQSTVSIGQSVVVMSPGCTGCLINHNYNNVPMTSYYFKAENETSRADIDFRDMDISQGYELTLKVSGQSDMKIGGWSAQNYSFTESNMEISIVWDKRRPSNYFIAQIDFIVNNGSAVFGTLISTLIAIITALL
ncbi:hypothetical protein PRIPAC_82065 [Pristionchus pacificus]|uniref:Uncharacterized protein n=1 Tax=Pristionchus pacificus TaxID=54126 RepID=A0A2A6CPK2_PRIPA|nr:hypothetical protein PRIPAC_82065 [Pristionchus pacificus]|eukprot:PDM79997.1 hypothetical protein PRIPAC_32576 [Pristionchus pacificus]